MWQISGITLTVTLVSKDLTYDDDHVTNSLESSDLGSYPKNSNMFSTLHQTPL